MSKLTTEASTLLSKLKGKRQHIVELLLQDKYTDAQIAERADSKVEYVWKTKSELKAVLSKVKSEPSSGTKQSDEPGSADMQSANYKEAKEDDPRMTPIEIVSKPEVQLSQEELKIVYSEFLEGKKPPEIIARYGFLPEAVEFEYKKYLQYTDCDVYALQKKFIQDFRRVIQNKRETRELANRYQKLGYLTNSEFYRLTGLVFNEEYERGLDALANGEGRPPEGYVYIPCSVCGKPLDGADPGAVVDPKDDMGKEILRFCKEQGWGHEECHKK